jgi:hypothetical protein
VIFAQASLRVIVRLRADGAGGAVEIGAEVAEALELDALAGLELGEAGLELAPAEALDGVGVERR